MERYKVLVRRAGVSSYQTFHTYIMANGLAQAKMIAEGMFGRENVINFNRDDG